MSTKTTRLGRYEVGTIVYCHLCHPGSAVYRVGEAFKVIQLKYRTFRPPIKKPLVVCQSLETMEVYEWFLEVLDSFFTTEPTDELLKKATLRLLLL